MLSTGWQSGIKKVARNKKVRKVRAGEDLVEMRRLELLTPYMRSRGGRAGPLGAWLGAIGGVALGGRRLALSIKIVVAAVVRPRSVASGLQQPLAGGSGG